MAKKILSMLTVLVLLASIATAVAETTKIAENFNDFDVTLDAPEGLVVTQIPRAEWVDLEMTFADESRPTYDLHISPTEEFTGVSMGELTDEEIDTLIAIVNEDFDKPEHEIFTTPEGSKVVLIRETNENSQFVTMQTIYRGFFVYLYGAHADFSPLTDEDITVMHQIVEGLHFESTGETMMPPADDGETAE